MALTNEDTDFLITLAVNAVVATLILLGFELARWVYPGLYNHRRAVDVLQPRPRAAGLSHDGAPRQQHPNVERPTDWPHQPTSELELLTSDGQWRVQSMAVEAATLAQRETGGFFGWLGPTLSPTVAWFERHRGRDAGMYLRFITGMLWMFLGLLVLLFIVVVPTNAAGGNRNLPPDNPSAVSGLLVISMTNLEDDSSLYWVHAIMVLVVTIIACVVAWRLEEQYLHSQSAMALPSRMANRTLLFTRKASVRVHGEQAAAQPADEQTNDQRSGGKTVPHLVASLERAFPAGEVTAVHPVRNDRDLWSWWSKELKRRGELSTAVFDASEPQRALGATNEADRVRSAGGDPVEDRSVSHRRWTPPGGDHKRKSGASKGRDKRHEDEEQANDAAHDDSDARALGRGRVRLHQIRERIRRRQAEVVDRYEPSKAFVVFRTRLAAVEAQRHAYLWPNWSIIAAPPRQDVNWRWFDKPRALKLAARVLSVAVVLFFLLFWAIPVTFIQGLGNLEELAALPAFNWLQPLLDAIGPSVLALLSAYLPALLLLILVAVMGSLFRALTMREGRWTWTSTERATITRYYFFLVFNVFLVTTLAGTAFNALADIITGEEDAATMLAQSLPEQGLFFVQYIMVKSAFLPLQLLHIPFLLFYLIRGVGRPAGAHTFIVQQRPVFPISVQLSWDLLVATIALTYSLFYPFILIFAVSYFGIQCVIQRYNFRYIYRSKHEMQGRLWPRLRDSFFVGLGIFQPFIGETCGSIRCVATGGRGAWEYGEQWTMLGWFALRASPAMALPLISTILLIVVAFYVRRLGRGGPDPLARWLRPTTTHGASTTGVRRWWMRHTDDSRRQPEQPPPPPADAPHIESARPWADQMEPVCDDDDYDGLTFHGQRPVAEAEALYYVNPAMVPPSAGLLDDPYDPYVPQS